jgi:hypothetical protein
MGDEVTQTITVTRRKRVDFLHRILKWVDHNRFTVLGVLLSIGLSVWLVGCQPETTSTLDPSKNVTAPELQQEIQIKQAQFNERAAQLEIAASKLEAESRLMEADAETYNEAATAAVADLQKQEEQRKEVIRYLGGLGTAIAEGTVNPASLIGGVTQLLLLGLAGGIGADNIRKGVVIKRQKNSSA